MHTLKLMAAAIGMMALAACQSISTQANNPAAWAQIATGVGQIVGQTKLDPQIEKVSAKLAAWCAEVQTAAVAVDVLAPAKLQRAASDARVVVNTFCSAPPTSVATAINQLAAAYAAIEAARGDRA